jgi:hypothetical protein
MRSTWPSPSATPRLDGSTTPTTAASTPALAFGRRLADAKLAGSMGTVGDALDTAVAES